MNSRAIRLVVVLGVVSIIGITLLQIYWVRRAFDQTERQFQQSLYIALKNVATDLAAYRRTKLPNQSPVSQVASNYYVVNVNDVIDANLLEFYLRREFNRLNLRTDYEYAIYDCATDRMVYGNYVPAPDGRALAPAARRPLPKWNRYTYYFGLYLPSRTSYLVSQLDMWVITSGLLLVVIGFFGYALFVILRQKQLSEIQRDFINTMSHEFKTPIATIGIAAEVLGAPDAGPPVERRLRYARIIQDENNRLLRQVDKVLQVAKSEAREFRLQREPVDLHALLAQVLTTFDLPGRHSAAQLETSLAAPTATVWADPVHLANVLFNLLDNAVKYTGPTAPHLRVQTRQTDRQLLLSFTDHGPGIAPAHQRRVFDKFFRVPAGNASAVPGFGLGLYYVRNVVAAHGWKIALNSATGQGCTFTLTLPLLAPSIIPSAA